MRVLRPILCVAVLGACNFDNGTVGPLGGALTLSGNVQDFATHTEIATGTLEVTATDLTVDPLPDITTSGTTFSIEPVPENAVFDLVASVAPTHYATANTVKMVNVDRAVTLSVVSVEMVNHLTTECRVDALSGGIVLAKFVDPAGQGRPQIKLADLSIAAGVTPCFLDETFARVTDQTQTTSAGWVIYFKVPAGFQTISTAPNPSVTFSDATVRVTDAVVTIAQITVTDGVQPLPEAVSFSQQILPIFGLYGATVPGVGRGCVMCHTHKKSGAVLGGLSLEPKGNGTNPVDFVYDQLVIQRPGIRVNPVNPTESRVLTRPTRGYPDLHLNIFPDSNDRDYRLIQAWITEGAIKN